PRSHMRVDVLYVDSRMAGGAVYAYYERSNCGIIDYFCVHSMYRNRGYGALLVRAAERQIHDLALEAGHHHASAVFMETNRPDGPSHGDDFPTHDRFVAF